jgi:hypothetical protein
MSPRISICPEPVLASHAPSPSAAGSHDRPEKTQLPIAQHNLAYRRMHVNIYFLNQERVCMLTYKQKHTTCRSYGHVKKTNMHVVTNVHVVVYYCRTYYKTVCARRRRKVEDICYRIPRDSAFWPVTSLTNTH